MKTEDLTKLATARRKIDADVKAKEQALKEELAPHKERIKKIDAKLGTVINKSGEDGTMKSFTLPDGSLAYASESDKYSTRDRSELDQWVLEPLQDELVALEKELEAEADEDLREMITEAIVKTTEIGNLIGNRLGIFTNSIVKDVAISHRKDTGASDVEGALEGGKLPGGVRMFKETKVNYRKGS